MVLNFFEVIGTFEEQGEAGNSSCEKNNSEHSLCFRGYAKACSGVGGGDLNNYIRISYVLNDGLWRCIHHSVSAWCFQIWDCFASALGSCTPLRPSYSAGIQLAFLNYCSGRTLQRRCFRLLDIASCLLGAVTCLLVHLKVMKSFNQSLRLWLHCR